MVATVWAAAYAAVSLMIGPASGPPDRNVGLATAEAREPTSTVACYLSLNPTPVRWIVSGPEQGVRAFLERTTEMGAELEDRASGRRLSFAQVVLPRSTTYGQFMMFMNAVADARLDRVDLGPVVPNCAPDGGADDLENDHALVVVGVFGGAEAVAAFRETHAWASFSKARLEDGRTGASFVPTADRQAEYEALVATARAGGYGDLAVVMLDPASR